VKVQTNII